VPILDTDVLSIVQRRIQPEYSRLHSRLDAAPGLVLWVTIVSFEEQLRGWLEYVKRAKPPQLRTAYSKLHELNDDFSTRPVLDFDDVATERYVELLHAKTRIGAADLKIASLAIAKNELLITRNIRHFAKIPGLRAEDWTR
jgi:tRNA(fMet)-specific endonuclease VapC